MKKNKTCYLCDKSSHFVKNYRLREMMFQRQINVMLKKTLDEWNTQNINSNNSKITNIITNDEYFRIKNSRKLQQILNEKVTSTTFASNQKINNIIWKTYNKTSYFVESKSYLNEKYKYDNEEMTQNLRKFVKEIERATIKIKNNAIEVVNILEKVINNDVIKKEKISLFLRFKLRRQNVIVTKKTSLMCNNYWKNCQDSQCRQYQKLWRQWLNIQRHDQNN